MTWEYQEEKFWHVRARSFCVKFGMRWREASFSFRRESCLLSRPTLPLTPPCFNMVRYSLLSLREWSESFSLRERQAMLPLRPHSLASAQYSLCFHGNKHAYMSHATYPLAWPTFVQR
jgi:hypothetical protein